MGLTKVTRGVIEPFENYDVNNINATGIITATSFDGIVQSSSLTGALPALDGSALTGVVGAGSGIVVENSGTPVGTAGTVNFDSNLNVSFGAGTATVTVGDTDLSIADKIVHTGDTNTAIRFPAADTFTVETAGSERVRVDSSGNVGIGTENPANKLEVGGAISAEDLFVTSGGDTTTNNISGKFSHGGINSKSLVIGADPNNVGGDTRLQFDVDGTERMRITSDGSVGIGTDNPTEKLHVLGDARITGILTVGTASITIDGDAGTITGTTFTGTATTATNLSDAANITTGTLADARIPDLDASKTTAGTLADARIPDLDASKITAGTLADARIPNLDASKTTSGSFSSARIPNLDASKITAGTLNVNITTSRVTDEIATSTAGTKGSYAFLGQTTNTARSPNATLAGSSLLYANANGPESTSPGGSWRLMGRLGSGEDQEKASLWVRYA
jgi:hypothetical protein